MENGGRRGREGRIEGEGEERGGWDGEGEGREKGKRGENGMERENGREKGKRGEDGMEREKGGEGDVEMG